MNKWKLGVKSLRGSLKDEFGISGAKKTSKSSILKHNVFGVYLQPKDKTGPTPEELEAVRSEVFGRIGVDDFELYKALWMRYCRSIQGKWGTSSLPTVGGFERWLHLNAGISSLESF